MRNNYYLTGVMSKVLPDYLSEFATEKIKLGNIKLKLVFERNNDVEKKYCNTLHIYNEPGLSCK